MRVVEMQQKRKRSQGSNTTNGSDTANPAVPLHAAGNAGGVAIKGRSRIPAG